MRFVEPARRHRSMVLLLTRFRRHSRNGPLRSRRESTWPIRQSSDEKRCVSPSCAGAPLTCDGKGPSDHNQQPKRRQQQPSPKPGNDSIDARRLLRPSRDGRGRCRPFRCERRGDPQGLSRRCCVSVLPSALGHEISLAPQELLSIDLAPSVAFLHPVSSAPQIFPARVPAVRALANMPAVLPATCRHRDVWSDNAADSRSRLPRRSRTGS